jgi:hypothetical protein
MPTKKKRQTKHRGNAAGQVQARGRTGRKPTAEERKGSSRDDARARRAARLDTPPTWRSAINRALAATAIFFLLLVFFFRSQQIGPKVAIAVMMLAIYVPMGYYTDVFVYRRRQARKLREQAARRDGSAS